jgi:hypothetical protein
VQYYACSAVDWQDPDEAGQSDIVQALRGLLDEVRLWSGSDHGECQCASYEGTVGGLQASVRFLRMVRELYKGSDEGYAVFDACFILLDKMLHREIGHQEVFDRLHCMFVNDFLLVEPLLWLGALNLVWTRTEVEERIRDLEDHYKERLRDIRERTRELLRPV